ncbi:MAG: cryptochrome/photolyase family protein [Thermoanaerobaculia bacterium]|nr:cryptochrome/photolyase family protein [Thermoanaerobaculia bacterium]
MPRFAHTLAEVNPPADGRGWVYVPYDQLTDDFGPLADREPGDTGIVLVESTWKGHRRPYHRQKLALILANQRHFAVEQARRGVAVRHLVTDRPYGDALRPLAEELGGLTAMEPAERELRADLEPLVDDGLLEVVDHAGWLTTREQFDQSTGGPPWRMDAFYRRVRRDTGYLMDEGGPAGGRYSHDADNREPWDGTPKAPQPPVFEPDELTREVGDLIESRFALHPGRLDLESLPATRDDAERLWRWALDECMESFGPYEDAMSSRSRGLFHTRIGPLLNISRLTPRRVVEDALATGAPLSSREGFLRQIAGWREFVRHVHRATDGFRELDRRRIAHAPGDGGWSRWNGAEWPSEPGEPGGLDGGATPSHLDAGRPLPPAWWGATSGLACLDTVISDVWREAYSHHITRLMVLANLGTLLGVEPRQLADWFWVAYADAYDWVVEPNVLAMGSFATGDLMTTKPYVSGANYIDKMSDYCGGCRFDPKRSCPITPVYWAFLARNEERLDGNRRMSLVMGSLRKRGAEKRARDRLVYERVLERLGAGEEIDVGDLPPSST